MVFYVAMLYLHTQRGIAIYNFVCACCAPLSIYFPSCRILTLELHVHVHVVATVMHPCVHKLGQHKLNEESKLSGARKVFMLVCNNMIMKM